MSSDKTRLFEAVEAAARAVTDDEGRFEAKRLREELAARMDDLPDHVRVIAHEMQVAQLVQAWRRARTPRPVGGAVLFNPSAIIPLGHGQSVWMDVATSDDLRAWGLLSTRNLARVAVAEGSRQEYIVTRLEVLRDRPGRLLGEIEREVFGWVESAPDWDDDEDEDDE